MWQEISNDREIQCFMDKVCFFHDSCIKELKYISGAYVNADLSMHPINDRRLLSVIIRGDLQGFERSQDMSTKAGRNI